ncbi:phosphonate C-P lyase system protein PhnH [Paenibacillus periandrae]|uniref:phosphonate C-P lyase system protein PhnH n=1 Tax=Paenibacillus periandrae TaxID=1761741 RepID=UPI001F08D577|nr:phosphonate C-P lyase system protein PhnH [Paenibacillus periandrae]
MAGADTNDGVYDLIHDTSLVYRTLLDAMSRPGSVGNIGAAADKLLQPAPENRMGLALALALLDADVRFAVRMKDGTTLEQAICRQTYAQTAVSSQADYVFVDGDLPEAALERLFTEIRCGTMQEPEDSATLFVRVDEVADATLEAASIVLAGPGIYDRAFCRIKGLSPVWISERARLNAEYPVGIDLIVFDGQGNVMALPRTTSIEGRTIS